MLSVADLYQNFNRRECVSISPEEVPAEGTEGGLSEELGHELVSLDAVDLLVPDGTPPPGDARH